MSHQLTSPTNSIRNKQPISFMRLLVFCFCLASLIELTLCASLGEQTITSRAIYVKDKSETNKSHQLSDLIKYPRQEEEEGEGEEGEAVDLIDLGNRLITSSEDQQDDELQEAHHQPSSPIITLGQFSDDLINENNNNSSNQKRQSADIKNLLDVDNSTLNAAVNPEKTNLGQSKLSQAHNTTINELERPFLSLFDELWRIKNTSAIALIRLDYLQLNETISQLKNDTTNGTTSQQETTDKTNKQTTTTNPDDQCTGGRCNYFISQQLPGKRFGPIKLVGSVRLQQNQASGALSSTKQKHQPLANVVGQFNGWFAKLQQRVNHLMERLYSILVGRIIKQQPLRTTTTLIEPQRDDKLSLSLTPSTEDDQRSTKKKKRQTTNELDNPKGLPELESSDDSSKSDLDRNINNNNNNNNNNEASSDANCINLTIDEELRCKSTETLIETTLNHSFPGTVMSIETNCAHVTFLLASCWPQQLQQLKTSIASWNETLLTLTEFPLPIGSEEEHNKNNNNNDNNQRQSISCGYKESKSNQTIKDRVNWMWLNLCLDRKFRQDYLDNLRCLSLWSQERAQQVCSHEYRRMQAYLVTQSEVIGGQLEQAVEGTRNKNRANEAKRRAEQQQQQQQSDQYFHQQQQLQHETSQPASNMDNFGGGISIMDHLSSRGQYLNGTGTLPSRLVDSRGQPTSFGNNPQASGSANGNGPDSAQLEREVSSKMLCCMFDQFLRCFNRQAIRDCGRTGAQFVVNFMSRIGTDDMKYLCNSESRTTPTGASRTPIMTTTTTTTITTTTTAAAAAPNTHKQSLSSSSSSSSSSGSRRVNNHQHHINDKGPFIENNYCSDPRIQNALFGLMGAQHSGDNRNKAHLSSNSNPWQGHQVGGRGKTRNHLISVNHDPTFFGTDLATDSASWTGQRLIPTAHYVFTVVFIIPLLLIVVI